MTDIVDPYSPEDGAQPGLFYDELRRRCPVARVERGETPFYIVSGYSNVVEVMNDHETWSKIDGALLQKTEHHIALSNDPPEFRLPRHLRQLPVPPRGGALGGAHSEAGR